LKGDQLEQAETEFKNELKLNPQNFTAMYKLATVLIERSNPEAAAGLLTKLLPAHPESAEVHYQLGRAEAQLGQSEAAIRDFTFVVKDSEAGEPEMKRQSFYQLAQLYRRAQRPEESRLALNTFVRLKQQADEQRGQKLQDKLKRHTESEAQ
jgi:tetratricopeptide (TPR) repeat protein